MARAENKQEESESETREPFRSRVINSAQKKDRRREALGLIPVTRVAFHERKLSFSPCCS